MSPIEITVIVAYVAVLLVLSVYGSHRYYMAWLYYRHKFRLPTPRCRFDALPRVTVQLPIFNELYVVNRLIEAVCRLEYPLDALEIQVLDDSTDETTKIAREGVDEWRARGGGVGGGVARARCGHHLRPPDEPPGLQGGGARERAQAGEGGVRRRLRRRLRPGARLPAPDGPLLQRPGRRDGPGALGASQPSVQHAHPVPEHPPRRALRHRAHGAQPVGSLLQLQRHRRDLAARDHLQRGRVAARHAHRGPRPLVPGAARRLEVRLLAAGDGAGRDPGGHERLQEPAAPLGEGVHPDRPEALAAHLPRAAAVPREAGGVLPPHRQLRVSPDDPARAAHARHRHGARGARLVRGHAPRPALLRRGDRLGLHLLLLDPARGGRGAVAAPEVQ